MCAMLNLNEFMNKGINNIADTAGRFYFGNLKGQSFMLHTMSALRTSVKVRAEYEKNGIHIPPFLIASIASSCNLHCAGCYARANGGCSNEEARDEMGLADWQHIFNEASQIGISFILLAGGEPLLRRDIIKLAAQYDSIIFPIFTNGTMIDDGYLNLFDKHRNLIPVLSMEGNETQTDKRRGKGISEMLQNTSAAFRKKGILYGVSLTVTSENKENVTDSGFVHDLRECGCGLIFYVEYVPVEKSTEYLMLNNEELRTLQERMASLRADKRNKGMTMLSFPGDEEAMGGCLAAGRGFFHINASGRAEPCPFSPYSEINLKRQSMVEALQSPFFGKVHKISAAEADNYKGGCTLFQCEKEVKQAFSAPRSCNE